MKERLYITEILTFFFKAVYVTRERGGGWLVSGAGGVSVDHGEAICSLTAAVREMW